jgi:hypothetical protein
MSKVVHGGVALHGELETLEAFQGQGKQGELYNETSYWVLSVHCLLYARRTLSAVSMSEWNMWVFLTRQPFQHPEPTVYPH